MSRRYLFILGVVALGTYLSMSTPVSCQELLDDSEPSSSVAAYVDVLQFGGPSSVAGQIAEDSAVEPGFRWRRLQEGLQPWFELKESISKRHGLQFTVDESIFYQVASNSPGESHAASGLVRILGQWELVDRGGRNPGMIVFRADDRHKIGTGVTPFDLGFEAGSVVPTGTFFNDFSFSATNLFWKQYFFDRRMAIAVGRIDVTDFIDVYAMTNPLTHFINLAFSLNPTIAAPNQGLGAVAGGMLTDRLYVLGGFSDANGQPTLAGFNTFFDNSEYFSFVEFGATSSQDRIYLDNVHVTLWHSEARLDAGAPSGSGVAVTAQKFINERWLPFVRYGYSHGDAALMQSAISTGIGLRRSNNDVAGIGVSWGKPSTEGLSNQFTSEAFYRFQLTQYLAITPDIQLIVDPALNPESDVLAMFGIRLRAAF